MAIKLNTEDAEATEAVARKIGSWLRQGSIIALTGPLGSGKTVFVRGIARGLGIEEPVTSPSFTIVSEYDAPLPLVHIDLYRTGSDEELELLGFEELLARPAVIAIEWAEKAMAHLPDQRIDVAFQIAGEERVITIDGIPDAHLND